ncbi:MAG: CBS domain-containing protein [Fimbriimonadaceae bacterium]
MILREVLHAHIPTLTHESTVRDAVDKMDIYQFPALVIVDQNQTPTHVITEGDLARATQKRGQITALTSEPAYLFATEKPTVATPNTEISDALYLMLNQGLTILPIVDETILIGIVLRIDLMQALLMDTTP